MFLVLERLRHRVVRSIHGNDNKTGVCDHSDDMILALPYFIHAAFAYANVFLPFLFCLHFCSRLAYYAGSEKRDGRKLRGTKTVICSRTDKLDLFHNCAVAGSSARPRRSIFGAKGFRRRGTLTKLHTKLQRDYSYLF